MNNRLGYIDAIRGFAMLIVVYGHVNFFSFKITPFIGTITGAIQMPLFFFISGCLVYKANSQCSIKSSCLKLWDKFKMLIVPAMVMGVLYSYLMLRKSPLDFVMEHMKYGYWFPISLFSMYVVYELCKVICQNKIKFLLPLLILVSIVMWLLKYILIDDIEILNDIFVLWQTFTYQPFFVLGVILCVYRERYEYCVSINGFFNTILLVLFVLSMSFSNSAEALNIKFPVGGVLSLIIGSSASLLLLNFFIKHKSYFNESFVGRSLQTIGRRTLEIYLLHYFLLPDLTYATKYVDTSSTIVGLAINIVISILIIIVSLMIGNVIRLSPVLASFLLGVKYKKQS